MSAFWQDLKLAVRVLGKSPWFAVMTVLTLGLGIAASSTVFGWIDTALLRPIPGVEAPEQLAALEALGPDGRLNSSYPHPDLRDLQRQMTTAAGIVGAHTTPFTVGPVEQPRRVMGQVVSANFFTVLGVRAFRGRVFTLDEDRDDAGAFPIAVISHRLWQGYFRGEADVVGRVVRINGRQLTIVGIVPPEFHGTVGGAALDVWVPLSQATQVGALNTWAAADRNARFLDLVVRLKPGVNLEQARAEVAGIAQRNGAAYPDTHRGIRPLLIPVWQASSGLQRMMRDPLRLLSVVCLVVLLISCANVANLLMARSVSRRREFGIRMALGGGNIAVVRSLLMEVVLLAGAAAIGGVLLAQWLGTSLSYVFPTLDSSIRAAAEPLLHPTPNPRVLLFTALVSMVAAVLASVLPALAASRLTVNDTLKEGGRTGTAGSRSHRARGALVIAEVALASVALVGAGLAIRSFQRFTALQTGFDPNNVLVGQFYLSTNGYTLEQERQFCHTLTLRLRSVAGIEQATCADSVPLSLLGPSGERVQVAGSAVDRSGVVSMTRSIVAPGYFDLMRIPLLSGRDFTDQDDAKNPRVVIVNQAFARKYFEGNDPVGRKVKVSGRESTIIGMVKDSKYRSPQEGSTPVFYGSFRQIFFSGHHHFVYVRTLGDMNLARTALRREVAAMDPNSALYEAQTLMEHTGAALLAERIAASLLSVLALLSLLLAAAGLYSVMAYAVNERVHEFGIRMALGAQRRDVLTLVLRKGLVMTAAGLVAGAVTVFVSARLASSTLDVPLSVNEPAVFVGAAATLILIALLATYIPARRATQVDPMTAVRAE